MYDQLQTLFPDAAISINHSSPSTKFKYNFQGSQGYFVVAPYVEFSKNEVESLKSFVGSGNVLVLSTYFLGNEIEEWLQVEFDPFITFSSIPDSLGMLDLATGDFLQYYMGKGWAARITKYDSAATGLQILSRFSDSSISSISFKKGDGYIVLHTQPFMFSNYHLLKKRTKAYSELFFSALPGPLNTIIWDEYTKSAGSREMAPLKYIMSQPPLRNAFWWALAGLILLVFFSFKRRQRIIPVLEPLTNNSLDMARTVSDMYYFSRKNEVMAKKKIAHWLEFLRTKYNIFTNQTPEAFWQTVKMRSGMPDDKMEQLQVMFEKYRNGEERISDIDLIKLTNLIDSFYKS